MNLRKLILKVTSMSLTFIIAFLIIITFIYKQTISHKYTYIINNSMGISDKCYIDKNDFRICYFNNKPIKVTEYYYEED